MFYRTKRWKKQYLIDTTVKWQVYAFYFIYVFPQKIANVTLQTNRILLQLFYFLKVKQRHIKVPT